MNDIFDARLKTSFGCICSGPPMSGKTRWICDLLRNQETHIDHPFDYIFWFYGEHNKAVEQLEKELGGKLISVHGLPDNIEDYIDKNRRGLHIYDDLQTAVSQSQKIGELCAFKTQHSNLSWIVTYQNLFYKSSERLNLYRCCHYLTVFGNILDKSQIHHLAHKILPGKQKLFVKMFEKATETEHSYLFIDGKTSCPQEARFRTDMFSGHQKVFIIE